MPEAATNVFLPESVPIILTALPARVLNAWPNCPSVMSLMTPSPALTVPSMVPVCTVLPAFRYAAIASPLAIPVTDGCGIDFMYLLLFGLLFLYARLAVFLTCPLRVDLFPFVRALDAL